MTDRVYIWRVFLVTLALLAVWAGLGIRLAFLHLGPNEELREKVLNRRHRETTIVGRRGRILDRHGYPLALDVAAHNVWADPKEVQASGRISLVASYLSHLLNKQPAMVFERLQRPGRRFEYIDKRVQVDVAEQLRRMRLDGVYFEDTTCRRYPNDPMLCHVIGFANDEGVGSAGIEQQMDQYLRPRHGVRVTQRDGIGHEIYANRGLEIQPQPGADVTLTVSQQLQYYVEEALDQAIRIHNAESAWVIVERVRTGEILALASRPSYSLQNFRGETKEAMRNRAIAYLYEPGSTMKACVLAAALNEGIVNPDEIVNCENGMWVYGGRTLQDYHPESLLSVRDVIKKSSNIGMAKIGLRLGDRHLENYLRAFGFGRATEIDLPGEESGIFHGRSRWSNLSITRISMGHEIAVNALQLLNAYCCIANDGFLMRPYIVSSVQDENGLQIVRREPEVVGRPIRPETARLMRQLLVRVTEDGGTAKRARVEGYSVAGKTGTAQKPIPGGYSDTENIASFVGFLPAEKPEIGIVVVVDNPQPVRTGGAVAAPVFKQIAEVAVRCLDIPPYVAPATAGDKIPPAG